jgi:hypothetical protein
MDFVVANPAWMAIICFGVVAIISGIMLTGRDLDPIERVLPSISSIQKWCGIGILFAAVFVFLASPLSGRHLLELENRASQQRSAAATAALAQQISTTVVEEINAIADEGAAVVEAEVNAAITNTLADAAAAGQLAGTTQQEIADNSAAIGLALGEALDPVLSSLEIDEATKAELQAGIEQGIQADMTAYYPTSLGILTNKADVTFYNPLSAVWGTMLVIFAIIVLVFSQVTAKYGDQKPLSTMLAVLWPVIIAMAFYTMKLRSASDPDISDTPGVMLDMFILLLLAAIAIPMCVMGMRERPREAGEYSGYVFMLVGIDAIYIGIKYLYLFEVKPFLGLDL